MDAKSLVTFIGIILVFIVGIINIFLTGHKNATDGVTKYRTEWIAEVRKLVSQVLSGETDGVIWKIEQLMLYLNPSHNHDLDKDLVHLLCILKNTYVMDLLGNQNLTPSRLNFGKRSLLLIGDIEDRMHVYLKMEWTRVKYESAFNKIPYHYCWKCCWWPWSGFDERRAIDKIAKDYEIDLSHFNFK